MLVGEYAQLYPKAPGLAQTKPKMCNKRLVAT